nr:LysR family substrate-binding domain-containing protein [Sneathiella glossodoripedis]
MVLPTSHPLAKSKVLTLSDFASDEFITFAPETSPNLHNLIIQCCSDAGFIPKIVQTAPQIQTHISLVAAGLGVSLVPECAAQVTHPNVAFRKFKSRKSVNTTTMAIACLKARDNPVLKAFINCNTMTGS